MPCYGPCSSIWRKLNKTAQRQKTRDPPTIWAAQNDPATLSLYPDPTGRRAATRLHLPGGVTPLQRGVKSEHLCSLDAHEGWWWFCVGRLVFPWSKSLSCFTLMMTNCEAHTHFHDNLSCSPSLWKWTADVKLEYSSITQIMWTCSGHKTSCDSACVCVSDRLNSQRDRHQDMSTNTHSS